MDGIDFISAINTLPTVASVTGQGAAVGEFDRISFTISITGRGNNGSTAKKNMAGPLAQLQELLQLYQKEDINFVENKTVSPFRLERKVHWDKNDNEVFSHYEAIYGLTFVVMGVEHTTRILDDLTEIRGLATSNPLFLMGDDQEIDLRRQALKNAVANARQTFELQCHLLGLKAENYEVLSWNSNSNCGGPTGITGSTGSTGITGISGGVSCSNSRPGGPRIIVNPGEAQISASITVSFTKTPEAIMDYVARSAKACEESDLF